MTTKQVGGAAGLTFHSTTTLNAIRAARPCKDGWEKLMAHLGKTKADDEPLDLLTILNSNGLDDALWVLSYGAPDCERLARHFQAWCAEQVLHHFEAERPDDHRVRDQIAMLRNDDASKQERRAARAEAWDAAQSAARAEAWAAARAATRAAAWAAAWDAARAAAWVAARAAARAAARDAQERQLRKMIGGEA